MAKKKVNTGKEKEEKPKPIDRTQIYVALIGLVGTLIVALIAFWSSKAPEKSPNNSEATLPLTASVSKTNSPSTGISKTQIVAPSNNTQTNGNCMDKYLTNVPLENQQNMEVGANIRLSVKNQSDDSIGPYAIQLTENGNLIGALQFLGFKNTSSFKILSVIDANCIQTNEFGNIDIPSKQAAIDNWENLGFHISSGHYRLRMGLKSGIEIELFFVKADQPN
jgi:hypothetical protein